MILGTTPSRSAHATFVAYTVALHVILTSLPCYTGVVAGSFHGHNSDHSNHPNDNHNNGHNNSQFTRHLRRRADTSTTINLPSSLAIKKGATQQQQHRKLACGELGYHLNQVDKVGCSNDDQYLPQWTRPELKSRMFHSDPQDCCKLFFKGDPSQCPIKDVCGDNGEEGGSSSVSASLSTSTTTSQSSCSNKWHVELSTQGGCSNDDNYKKNWPPHMFFDTPEKCCAGMFPGRRSCTQTDVGCVKSNDSSVPAAPPTPSLSTAVSLHTPSTTVVEIEKEPSQAATTTILATTTTATTTTATTTTTAAATMKATTATTTNACSNKWHVEMSSQGGCSNDDNYLPQWPPSMFYSTPEECCERMFPGRPCTHDDVGCVKSDSVKSDSVPAPSSASSSSSSASPPTSTPPSCTNKWHVDMVKKDGCSNDTKNYPQNWPTSMFFDDPESCCTKMFPNKPCEHNDLGCNNSGPVPTPSSAAASPMSSTESSLSEANTCSKKWHVDISARDGCSNDDNYPSEWLEPNRVRLMFFDDAEDCCSTMFANRPCKHHDRGCGPAPAPSQGKNPEPTAVHSEGTTRPVISYTSRPTIKPKVYWMQDRTGMCLDAEEEPKPEWLEDTYSVYEACCMASWDSEACMMARPVDPNAPTQPPVMKPFSFYVDPMSGMCAEESEIPKPNWVETTYPVYEFCCRDATVSNEKLCMQARPLTINGISFGTLAPTDAPAPKYYADPGTGMCVDEATIPKPSHVILSFETYSRCCVLGSSNPATCLTSDPTTAESKFDSDSSVSTSSTTSSPPPDYYLQQSTAICVDLNSVQNPGWVDVTFGTNYDKCCDTSWNKQKCMEMKPSMAPTDIPTWAPSTPWPTETAICPEPYDASVGDYERGTEVEVNFVIYRCIGHPLYCNDQDYQPPQTDPGPTVTSGAQTSGTQTSGVIIVSRTNVDNSSGPWRDAWERVGICVSPPSSAPSGIPTTASPTCLSARWHPGDFERRICTNSVDYPPLWDTPPLSETYFVDTAEECCDKFYDGTRCRIRDTCS